MRPRTRDDAFSFSQRRALTSFPVIHDKLCDVNSCHEDHEDENVIKKQLINDLPAGLQKGLVRHLYAHEACVCVCACVYTSLHSFLSMSLCV